MASPAGLRPLSAKPAVVQRRTLFAGSGPFALSFQAAINPSTPAGSVIENTADFESALTTNFDSNTTSTTLGGPSLVVAKSALGSPDWSLSGAGLRVLRVWAQQAGLTIGPSVC